MPGDQLGNFMYEVPNIGAAKSGGPSSGGGGHGSPYHNALGGSKKSSPRPGVGNPVSEEFHQ